MDETALMLACANGNYGIVKLLLSQEGIKVHTKTVILFHSKIISTF